MSSANTQSNSSLASTAGLSLANGSNGGVASNYTLTGGTHKVTVNKKPIKLSGARKINRINRNIKLSSGQLRMKNQLKKDDVRLSGNTTVRVIKEGLNKIGTDGLKLVGKDSSNYSLLGETHEFLFELKAKFKALRNIENKIAELSKSGKKIITGATQAIPKVVAMSSTPNGASPGAVVALLLVQVGQLAEVHQVEDLQQLASSAGPSTGSDGGASGDSSTEE